MNTRNSEISLLKEKYRKLGLVVYNRYTFLIMEARKKISHSRDEIIRGYIKKYNEEMSVLQSRYSLELDKINAPIITPTTISSTTISSTTITPTTISSTTISSANIPSTTIPQTLSSSRNALLIGMNYPDTTYKLSGCVNDINTIEKLLIEKFNFKNIVKLHDSSSILPTKINILLQLKLLLTQSNSGDVLFFHYSGHGSQIKDINGDETDGMDEVIIPVDYFSNNSIIVDDEIKGIIQENLKEGVKLIVLMDCCNSGTIFDLKYNYDSNWNQVVNNKSLDTKGDIILISGCSDSQKSYDTYVNSTYQGSTTRSFTESIKTTITWKQMINDMRQILINFGLSVQVPQISSGRPFNINNVIVI